MPSADDLAADIADMERLIAGAERPKVRAMLSDYLNQLRAEQLTRSGSAATAAARDAPAPAPAPAATAKAPAAAQVIKPSPPPPAPIKMPTPATSAESMTTTYTTIGSMAWDQDEYGKDPNFVYVYIMSGVDGVGDVKDSVTCQFTEDSFDLKIMGLNGKNYRLKKDNLEKSIVPSESKCIVKKNKVTIKMKKVKGQYGYDSWLNLTATGPKRTADGKEKDPGASLMDMMKDMYDNGDDNMKKALGEAMLKSRQKEMAGPPGLDDLNDDFEDPLGDTWSMSGVGKPGK